jgi:serine/threonine-protein kinase RsbW
LAERVESVHVSLPAQPENVGVVRAIMTSLGEVAGMSAEQIGKLTLATSEACTNVVVHAYRDRAGGRMDVCALVDGGRVQVVVRDTGPGIEPRPDSPGLGLGIPMMAAVADELEFHADGRKNEVRMSFDLER